MKFAALTLFLFVASAALLSARDPRVAAPAVPSVTGSALAPVDEPPPEPPTCPLCGGDPMLHAQRMLDIEAFATRLAAACMRW